MPRRPNKVTASYNVTWDKKAGRRYVWREGILLGSVFKSGGHWYSDGCFHATMRDAIIWVAYGIR